MLRSTKFVNSARLQAIKIAQNSSLFSARNRQFSVFIRNQQNKKEAEQNWKMLGLFSVSTIALAAEYKYGFISNTMTKTLSHPEALMESQFRSKLKQADLTMSDKQTTPKIYMLFDHTNPLHVEYKKTIEAKRIFRRIQHQYPGFEIILIDINQDQISKKECVKKTVDDFLVLAGSTREKVARKKNPSFFIKTHGDCLKKMP